MLLKNLRDQNPKIEIRNWVQVDLQKFAKDLGSERLANLFPELQGDHTVTDVAIQVFKELIKEHDAQKNAADAATATFNTNHVTLDQALDALENNDRAIRLRILGYCKWLDPMKIQHGVSLLADKGYAEVAISTNIERLQREGYVQVTRLHILPRNERICAEAANSVADEFIEMLGEV